MADKKCLLLVDIQNDFCSGGSLAVPDADAIVPVINQLMDTFDLILASRDMHPENTMHFHKWPVHCVRGTRGADFHPEVNTLGVHFFLEKGTSGKDDGYSDFESTNMKLLDLLQKNGMTSLYVCGLATEYCVKATVLDALRYGFKTYVITDCIRAVNLHPEDGARAIQEMLQNGAVSITSQKILSNTSIRKQ